MTRICTEFLESHNSASVYYTWIEELLEFKRVFQFVFCSQRDEVVLFNFEGESLLKKRIVGVNDEEVPPVPIPNTVVKLLGAENTWLETARENRAMPTFTSSICTFSSVGRATDS